MTLSKLSLRNARRQTRDYMVYFVTIVLAASLIYAFNGLIFSREILELSGVMSELPLIVVLASIVVLCILAWLVHYTIDFLFSRRSRELGTYILMGLENRQVSLLFFLENLAVGGCALLLGLPLGGLMFQVLRAVILTLFGLPYHFTLALSLNPLLLTLLSFVLIYLLAQLRSRKKLHNMKICDLIYYERQNEKEIISKSSKRQFLFTLSGICGILGTLLLLAGNFLLGVLGSACIITFLYGFFISFSSAVPAWFAKHPRQKYKGQNLLIFRILTSKLASMGILLATISLLLTAVLITEGTGLTFHAIARNRARLTSCFDLLVSFSGQEEGLFTDYLQDIQDQVPVTMSHTYEIYLGETGQLSDYVEDKIRFYQYYSADPVMKYSDYAFLRAMLGYPAVSLEPGHYLIHCEPHLKRLMDQYTLPIELGGYILEPGGVYNEIFHQDSSDTNGNSFLLVMPDEAVTAAPASHKLYAAMTAQPLEEAQYAALDPGNLPVDSGLWMRSKAQTLEDAASQTALFVLPLFYLALVLIMTAATILTIQQLSETNRYRSQFLLLEKMGMGRKEMKRTLRLQFAIYYAMPAVPPVLIGSIILLYLGNGVEPGTLTGASHPLALLGLSLGLFFLIYGVYIAMAYNSLKRNVLPL